MRNLHVGNIAVVCSTVLILCLVVRQLNVIAQSGCPGYTQAVTNSGTLAGMSDEAQINVSLLNNTNGTFSSDQQQAVQNAIDSITGVSGNNQDATVATTNAPVNPVNGTQSNPIIEIQLLNPTTTVRLYLE